MSLSERWACQRLERESFLPSDPPPPDLCPSLCVFCGRLRFKADDRCPDFRIFASVSSAPSMTRTREKVLLIQNTVGRIALLRRLRQLCHRSRRSDPSDIHLLRCIRSKQLESDSQFRHFCRYYSRPALFWADQRYDWSKGELEPDGVASVPIEYRLIMGSSGCCFAPLSSSFSPLCRGQRRV